MATKKVTTKKKVVTVTTVGGSYTFALAKDLMAGTRNGNNYFMPRAELRRALTGQEFMVYNRRVGARYTYDVTRNDRKQLMIGCMTFNKAAEKTLRNFAGL